MKNTVITIARGFGSGGLEIADKLSAALGIPCFERQLIKMASDYSGINESLFARNDEKLSAPLFAKNLRGIFNIDSPAPSPASGEFVSDDSLFQIQAKIIRDLANRVSCVIVGKCANKILAQWKNTVSVFIYAPREACVRSVMNKLCVSEREAAKMIAKTDRYRSAYYKYYTGGGTWRDPDDYDLIINSERIGRDACVELIKAYAAQKSGTSAP
ncbi:MAG: cytidylate kinase-like family protein [Oscillospiraceae bacterium]|nr:cytidylate kinase-like family protein [Oscillospiraceae bacterium]